MTEEVKKKQEVILETYKAKVDNLLEKMTFHYFENDKQYSFDYQFKAEFDEVINQLKDELQRNKLPMSPTISNKLPVFLPPEVARIAFFAYQAKSVRAIDPDDLENILKKQAMKLCRQNELQYSEVESLVKADLQAFKTYHEEHNYTAYRRDVFTSTVQFNAYDKEDNLLIEKSFVKGGLIFDMPEKDFSQNITVTYPRYRKQRTDKKDDYLPLRIMKIRGLKTKKVS